MAVTKQLVDGTQTLTQQEIALNYLEQSFFAKVTAYAACSSNVPPACANEAALEDVPMGQQPPPLHLEMADVNGNAAPIVAAQANAGKAPVFQEVGFVEAARKLIIAFR